MNNVPCSDLTLLRDVHKAGNLNLVAATKFNCFFRARHGIVFRVPHRHDVEGVWSFAVEPLDTSAIITWPCKAVVLGAAATDTYFEFLKQDEEGGLMSLLDVRLVVAIKVKWRSPAYQRRHWSPHFLTHKLGHRIFTVGPEATILRIAAEEVYWNEPMATVNMVNTLEGWPVGATQFQAPFTCVQNTLGLDDAVALEKLRHRFAVNDLTIAYSSALAACDEGIEVLDQRDHKHIKGEQKDAEGESAQRRQFVKEFHARRSSVRAAIAKAAPKPKAKAKAKAKASPPRTPLPSSIPQADARLYIPPRCSIWRSLTRGAWCAHSPPRARISEAWGRHGGDEPALRELLHRLWMQHLELEGQDMSACPYICIYMYIYIYIR